MLEWGKWVVVTVVLWWGGGKTGAQTDWDWSNLRII